jgi:hypothetical protein
MSLGVRIVLAVVVTGALAGLGALVLGGGEPAAGAPPVWRSSQQCKACHEDVFAEWQGSHHQIAFLNPEVRKLSDDFRNKECQSCHLPRPVFEVGLGQRALPRLTRPDEGVDCLACHLAPDGIVGKHDVPSAPCRPRREPAFDGVALCGTCHNQHQTTDQFLASPFAVAGATCHGCHMPEVQRPVAGGTAEAGGAATRRGFSHRFPGAHDEAMLRSAAVFEATREGDEIVVSVENRGAGHNFPTEERHRAVDLMVRFTRAGAAGPWQLLHRFRQPYRDEPGENTQLPSGARKEVRVTVPENAEKVEARLWYRLNPFARDEDAASTLLFEKEVPL